MKLAGELLGEAAPGALGEHRHLGGDVHAWLEIGAGLAVVVQALVAGADASDAFAVKQHFAARKTGEHVHAFFFGHPRHPLGHAAERDDVVAVVVHGGRRDGKLERRFFGEVIHLVGFDFAFDGCAFFQPVGHQLLHGHGVHDGPAELVIAAVAAFFNQGDHELVAELLALLFARRHVLVVLFHQPVEVYGAGKTCRTAAHDQYIYRELLAFDFAHVKPPFMTPPGGQGE